MIRMLPTAYHFTPVPNTFILSSMSKMSSTVIKIYLFLLYQFNQNYPAIHVDEIADHLNITESDINRALHHLAKEKLLYCEMENGKYAAISLSPTPSTAATEVPTENNSGTDKNKSREKKGNSSISTVESALDTAEQAAELPASAMPSEKPAETVRPNYNAAMIEKFSQDKDGNQLIFYTKTLLNKNLTAKDLHILYGLRDWLKMSNDLIYFLIDYCIDKNHTNLSYIEKVAIDWHENKVETVEQAKDYLATYPSHYFTVLKAYGIYNLAPIPAQIKMIDKWTKEYLMPMEAIVYACEKTILQTGKPELNYTDSILKKWKEQNLYTKAQIQKAETEHQKKNYGKQSKPNTAKSSGNVKTTSFNNYSQRDEDYDAIERKALEMRLKNKESKE